MVIGIKNKKIKIIILLLSMLIICQTLVSAVEYRGYNDYVEKDKITFADVYSPQIELISKDKLGETKINLKYKLLDSSSILNIENYLYLYSDILTSNKIGGVTKYSSVIDNTSEKLILEDDIPINSFVRDSSFTLSVLNQTDDFKISLDNNTIFYRTDIGKVTKLNNNQGEQDLLTINEKGEDSDYFYIKIPTNSVVKDFELNMDPQVGSQKIHSPLDFAYIANSKSMYFIDSRDSRLYRMNITDINNPKIVSSTIGAFPNLLELPNSINAIGDKIFVSDAKTNRTFIFSEDLKDFDILDFKHTVSTIKRLLCSN